MFVFLLVVIGICSGVLAYYYALNNHKSKANTIVWICWGIIYCSVMLCSNYLASVGLPFSQAADNIDFFQTLNSGYIGHYLQITIIVAILLGIYLFVMKMIKLPAYWIIILIGIYSIIMYYPGIPQDDTNTLYSYFLTKEYSDFQAPLYTLSWHIFGFYGAAFLTTLISYYAGLTVISYHLHKNNKKWQNHLLIMFSLNPIFFSYFNIVLKDTLFVGLLVDCVAISLVITEVTNKTLRLVMYIVSLIFIFVIIGIRYNGISTVIPFVWLILALLMKEFFPVNRKFWLPGILTLIILIIFTQLNIFIAYKVFNAKKTYVPIQVMLNDMANIECRTGHEFMIPSELFADKAKVEDLREAMCTPQVMNEYNYEPLFIANWNNLGNPAILVYDFTLDSANLKAIYDVSKQSWYKAIANYPITYLVYRARFFSNDFFGQYYMPAYAPVLFGKWPAGVEKPEDGLRLKNQQFLAEIASIQRYDMRYLLSLFVIAANIALLVYYIRNKQYFSLSGLVWLSNILTLVGLFIVVGEHPARYFLWNYVATLLSIILAGSNMVANNKVRVEK